MEKPKEQKGIETDESRKELAKNGIELNKKDKPKMAKSKYYGLRKVKWNIIEIQFKMADMRDYTVVKDNTMFYQV